MLETQSTHIKGMREDAMGKAHDNNLSISFLLGPHNYNTVKARQRVGKSLAYHKTKVITPRKLLAFYHIS